MWEDNKLMKLYRSTYKKGIFSDLYSEYTNNFDFTYEDGKVTSIRNGVDIGIGLRKVDRFKTSYSYTEDLSTSSLGIELTSNDKNTSDLHSFEFICMHQFASKCLSLSKIIENECLSKSNIIFSIKIHFTCTTVKTNIITVEDQGSDNREYISFSVKCSAIKNNTDYVVWYNKRFSDMLFEIDPYVISQKIIGKLNNKIITRPIKSGVYPIILLAGSGGLLFHEACGHALEIDSITKNSVFSKLMGEQIASERITLVDSPLVEGGWGSYKIDSEGMKAKETVLIENGRVNDFLFDRINGMKSGMISGNGRRSSYKELPLPRMSNTYLLPGEDTHDDIIANTSHGVLATNFSGGQVNPYTGDFSFFIDEAFLVQNGKVVDPIDGLTIFGNSRHTLNKIDMIGNDLEFSGGTCIKLGQKIPVGMGQPTVRLNNMFVAGNMERGHKWN